ncbi:MAG: hypothetical protein ACFBWO_06650 [Paracoccaceae bacterium]
MIAYLFTAPALVLRAAEGADPARRAKLEALAGCERRLLGEAAAGGRAAGVFVAVAPAPADDARWGEAARAVAAALDGGRRPPPDAVVMVGARAEERAWAEAGKLAKFLSAEVYFAA